MSDANTTDSVFLTRSYGVIMHPRPLQLFEESIAATVDRGSLGGSPQDYLAAIRRALASGQPLAGLLLEDHPQDVVRACLQSAEAKLAARLEAK
jgi:hypothetical protein